MTATNNVHVFPTQQDLSIQLAAELFRLATESIEKRGRFVVAFSGGSLPKIVSQGLLQSAKPLQLNRWHIVYADERLVPLTHPDSNHRLVHQELKLDDLPESNRPHLLPINTQLLSPLDADGTAVDASIAAKVSADYERALRLLTGAPAEDYSTPLIIDCLLLGMGPDGHTCSLFPEHPLLHRRGCSVSWLIDSPKPPAARITLTMAAIEAARSAFIVASGDGKRPILQQVFSAVQSSDFPVAMVNRMRLLNSIDPSTERVQWYLDQAAWPL